MTLKTDYTNALNTALTDAFTAGNNFVTANLTLLSTSLVTAAAAGQSVFQVLIVTSYLPESLKLNGTLLKAYLAGIYSGLTAQGIYHTYEVVLTLDTATAGTNKIKFSFTFNP